MPLPVWGVQDESFYEPLKLINEFKGQAIPTLKPWADDILYERLPMVEAVKPIAFAMDIDTVGLVHAAAAKSMMTKKGAEDIHNICTMSSHASTDCSFSRLAASCSINSRLRSCFAFRSASYVLRPVFEKSSKVYIPTNSSTVAEHIRPILSQREIDETILEAMDGKIEWTNDYKKRAEQFRQILSRRNEKELLQMISCLYLHAKESGKSLTSSNAHMLKMAQSMIEQEFAFSLNIEPEEVGKYIQMKLGLTD